LISYIYNIKGNKLLKILYFVFMTLMENSYFRKLHGNLLISGIFLKMRIYHVTRDSIFRKNVDIIFIQKFFKNLDYP
jgi:hypothetical protein